MGRPGRCDACDAGAAPCFIFIYCYILLSGIVTFFAFNGIKYAVYIVYRLRPGPVRDFGTERALAEPLGPNTTNFPNSCPRFTLLTELNLTVPKARPEAHTFDFIP